MDYFTENICYALALVFDFWAYISVSYSHSDIQSHPDMWAWQRAVTRDILSGKQIPTWSSGNSADFTQWPLESIRDPLFAQGDYGNTHSQCCITVNPYLFHTHLFKISVRYIWLPEWIYKTNSVENQRFILRAISVKVDETWYKAVATEAHYYNKQGLKLAGRTVFFFCSFFFVCFIALSFHWHELLTDQIIFLLMSTDMMHLRGIFIGNVAIKMTHHMNFIHSFI